MSDILELRAGLTGIEQRVKDLEVYVYSGEDHLKIDSLPSSQNLTGAKKPYFSTSFLNESGVQSTMEPKAMQADSAGKDDSKGSHEKPKSALEQPEQPE